MKTLTEKPETRTVQKRNTGNTRKSNANLTAFANHRAEVAIYESARQIAANSPQAKDMAQLQHMADSGSPNHTGLPDNLKAGTESLSGYAMDDVRVHYNSDKPAQLHAHAYAQGTDIHIAPGQEKHLPHEVWHVVQQKQGRVKATMQMKGLHINDSETLEKEADVMGSKILHGHAANSETNPPLSGLPQGVPAVQRVAFERVDPLSEPDAVDARRNLNHSRRCAGSGRIKMNGAWTGVIRSSSAGATGPQQHVERNILDQFVNGLRGQSLKGSKHPFARQLNIDQGNEAGELLKAANVTDIELYTELPPCWGCDPWVTQIDNKINGALVSKYSLLLANYYHHYNQLQGISFDRDKGSDKLFDYHIHYVLGETDAAKADYALLKGKGYEAPPSPASHSDLLDGRIETLQSIAFRHYDTAILMGMEVGNNDLFAIRLRAIVSKINATSPFLILNSFDDIQGQVEALEQSTFESINAQYNSIMENLDDSVDEDEYGDEGSDVESIEEMAI